MKCYVIYVSNGNLALNEITEHVSIEAAKAKFHDVCKLMWSDASVESAFVQIMDNQLDSVMKEAVIKKVMDPETKTVKKSSK